MDKTEKSWGKKLILAFQHVLAMFGATVLVPMLTGLPISVALFGAGVGTLIFHFCTKRKVPVFVGSSFAFIVAIQEIAKLFADQTVVNANGATLSQAIEAGENIFQHPGYQAGLPYALGGIVAAGILYIILAGVVRLIGPNRVKKMFPPVVTGPIIIILGMMLAPVAIGNITGFGSLTGSPLGLNWLVAIITILSIMAISVFAKGFFKLVPILFGIIIGYAASIIITLCGADMVDVAGITTRGFVAVPEFMLPRFNWTAVFTIAPIAIVPFVEHIGDMSANGAVVGKNFFKDPGMHRTLLGDGLATTFAGFVGAPANTTYSENTGVLATTKNYDPAILRIAAVMAIVLSFFGWFSGALTSMPAAVMGGVSIILFGMISSVGLRTLVENKVDFKKSRNMLIVAVMLVLGLGGAMFNISDQISISGVALAAIVGLILNKVLPEHIDRNGEKSKEAEIETADESK